MRPSLFLCLLAAGLVLAGILLWCRRKGPRLRANGRTTYDKGIESLISVIRRWMDEPVASTTPDLSGYRKLVLPAQVCNGLRALTNLSHECAGRIHFDESGHGEDGILLATRFDREDGGAMTSSVPTGTVVYHTHAAPAYRRGNAVNFPSPHDILGVVALAIPGRGNLCSLVATREGIYCLHARLALVGALAKSGNLDASCIGIADSVQRLVDAHTSSANIAGYCNGLESAGISCSFKRWDGSDKSALAFSIDDGWRSWQH
jgi:hypothetical protein